MVPMSITVTFLLSPDSYVAAATSGVSQVMQFVEHLGSSPDAGFRCSQEGPGLAG